MNHPMRFLAIVAFLGVASPAYAGSGTLVLNVSNAKGRATAADCEVRVAGQARISKRVACGTGLGQTGLAAGSYDVTCKSRIGTLRGTARVTVRTGATSRYRIRMVAGVTPLRLKRADTAGTMYGSVVDRSGRPLTGKVQIVLELNVVNGKFNAGKVPAGVYNVKFLNRGKVVTSRRVRVTKGKTTNVKLKTGATRVRRPRR